MSVNVEVVEHCARLSHIGLTADEVEEMVNELASILDHVARLAQLDTTDVNPTTHAVPMADVMRADEPRPSWNPESVLANAPQRLEDFFEVQAVLD